MGKIVDLFKNKLNKSFTEPGMTLNAETMKDLSSYTKNLKEEDVVEKWTEKYKKSIDCKHPKGFSQRAHCDGRKKKSEHTEATGSGSSGAFSGPLFGGEDTFIKRSFKETPKMNAKKLKEQSEGGVEKVEATEATGSGSVGEYSSPSMWAKSTKKKDWGPSRKTQIPGGGFVKVKKKCTKFPYCNQGDINALKITKNESVKEAIRRVSTKLNISEDRITKILEQEIKNLNKRTK